MNENTNAESINNNTLIFRLNSSRNEFIQFPFYYFHFNNNIESHFEDEEEENENFNFVNQMRIGTNIEEVYDNLGYILNTEK